MVATVTIASHTRVYSDKSVSVTGGTLTVYDDASAIADGDTVFVYYDDLNRQGGAVTLQATKVLATAVNSTSHLGRHFVGQVTVPGAGSSTTVLGAIANPVSVQGAQTGVNLKSNTYGNLTDSQIVTALGTAVAVTGQGALATQNTATTTQVVSAAGGTAQTDASLITNLGTAAALQGQGPWATYSGYSPSILASLTTAIPNLIYDAGLTQGGASWGLSGATVSSQIYGNVVTCNTTNTTILLDPSSAGVTAGSSYTFSFWTLTNNCPANVQFNWYGASGLISTDTVAISASGVQQATFFNMTKVAPAGSVYCQIGIKTKSTTVTGGTQFWRVKLEVGTIATPWNDNATFPGVVTTGQVITTTQLLNAAGTVLLNDNSVITQLGTAAAIANQGALATCSTVTPDLLAFSDPGNLVLNPSFLYGGITVAANWTFTGNASRLIACSSFSSTIGLSGTTVTGFTLPGYAVNAPTSATVTSQAIYSTYFDVIPGDVYYVEGWAWGDATNNGTFEVGATFYDASGGNATFAAVGQRIPQGTWTVAGGVLIVPYTVGAGTAQTRKMRFTFRSAATGGAANGNLYFTRALLKRAYTTQDGLYSRTYGQLTDARIVTSLGTAASIFAQGSLATLNQVTPAYLANGTGASSATFFRGDGIWATPTVSLNTSTAASTSTLTPALSGAFNVASVTAQNAALTVAAPTGTATDGAQLKIRITDNGTSQNVSWNAAYKVSSASGAPALLAATVAGKNWIGLFEYFAATSSYYLTATWQG